ATNSNDFPVTAGAIQTSYGGGISNAFALKLSSDGTQLIYSTFLGGSVYDFCFGMALDSAGAVCLTGETCSPDFPVTSGAFQSELNAQTPGPFIGFNVFLSVINASGSALVYSTYLGGSVTDTGFAVAFDGDGSVYVTGETRSPNFPTSHGAFQRHLNGLWNAFVAKFAPTGSLDYSTLIGGKGVSQGDGIVVNAAGQAYVCGSDTHSGFPTTAGSFQPAFAGGSGNAVVFCLDAKGSSLVFSTYLGGRGKDEAGGIALDKDGNVYFTGGTTSNNFPVTPDAIQWVYNKGGDGFVTKLSRDLSKLIYSTFLGGGGAFTNSIVLDEDGNAYVVGSTTSADFPTTPGTFQAAPPFVDGTAWIGFASKIQPSNFAISLTPQQVSLSPGESATVNISVTRSGGLVGPIEITPPENYGRHLRLEPSTLVSTDSEAAFTLVVKPSAASGQYTLVFNATDKRGVINHSASLNLNVVGP
ncbi:MAG TPA: SBBP repeat-containing protein, partial [Blastocatellia bacterium]